MWKQAHRKIYHNSICMRCAPYAFELLVVSLFLGATKLPYWKYALISLGGIMPRVILFTILGDGIYDYIPMDKIVLVIVCCIPAVIVWWVIKFFRSKKKNSSAG